jgi:hypothetical protein
MKTQIFPSLNARRSEASYERRTIRQALFRDREIEPIVVLRAHFHGALDKRSAKDVQFLQRNRQAGL